jgi:hypothetical protein
MHVVEMIMAATYSRWDEYSSRTENLKQWELVTKHVEDYMGNIVDDREFLDVGRVVYNELPTVTICISTYFKNKYYNDNFRLPLELLILIPQPMVDEILNLFVQTFRGKFLSTAPSVVKIPAAINRPHGRMNNLGEVE